MPARPLLPRPPSPDPADPADLCRRSLGLLYVTYGVVFACGCSFSYQPSLVILGHYFKRRLGLVNGIVTAGSSIFTITLPFVLSGLLERVGLQNTLRVLCVLMVVLVLAGFTYRPLLPPTPRAASSGGGGACRRLFNVNIWKSLGYRIWAFGIPAALYGYFVPYVHLVSPHFLFTLTTSCSVWRGRDHVTLQWEPDAGMTLHFFCSPAGG